MRISRALAVTAVVAVLTLGSARLLLLPRTAPAAAQAAVATPNFAVGSQYDTTHVYVAPKDFDRLVASLLATFGGTASKKAATTVTPTPSRTMWQALSTPVGLLSVLGFTTPAPYPFGSERTGYLVTDMDAAIRAARADDADVLVSPFNDPIGRATDTYRRIRIESNFGKLTVFVTDGHLPYPYGRETTGYEVRNLTDTLAKAKTAGVTILVAPYTAEQRNSAVVQFPGSYIAEIHSPVSK